MIKDQLNNTYGIAHPHPLPKKKEMKGKRPLSKYFCYIKE